MYDKHFIYKMAKKAINDNTVGIRTCYFKKKTFCISLVTGKSAMAKCHNNDLFDTYYGIGIAYCRLKGIKIKEEKSLKVYVEKSTLPKYKAYLIGMRISGLSISARYVWFLYSTRE